MRAVARKKMSREIRQSTLELVRLLEQKQIEQSEFELLIRMILFTELEQKLESFSEEKLLKWERRHAPERTSKWKGAANSN